MVEHDTNKYSMPPEACGFLGTLHMLRDRVRIVAGRYHAEHPRLPAGSGGVSNLPVHRRAMLEAVSGKRGRQYCMREHLFQLGPAAKEVITEIIYAELRSWNDSIERLHELLQLYGADSPRLVRAPPRLVTLPRRQHRPRPVPPAVSHQYQQRPAVKPPAVSPQQLEAMLKLLHLACGRRSYPELVEQAERGAWLFRGFLAALASAEIEHRRQTRLRRCVRQAPLPGPAHP